MMMRGAAEFYACALESATNWRRWSSALNLCFLTSISCSGDKTMKKVIGIKRSTTKLRYVLSLSLLLCVLSQQSVWSQEITTPPREDSRPCGIFFPCPQPEGQVEPNAGKWKTWLLNDV